MMTGAEHLDYQVFKGLQRPLEFLGFQGRYIYWAAGTAGGAIVARLWRCDDIPETTEGSALQE